MLATTIKVHQKTKSQLDSFREYKNESYDEVIQKVVFIAQSLETDPKLSKNTILQIEQARKRFKQGNFFSEEEALKRMGL